MEIDKVTTAEQIVAAITVPKTATTNETDAPFGEDIQPVTEAITSERGIVFYDLITVSKNYAISGSDSSKIKFLSAGTQHIRSDVKAANASFAAS